MTDNTETTTRLRALDVLRGELVRVAQAEARSSRRPRLRIAAVAAGAAAVALGATAGVILTRGDERAAPTRPTGFAASGPLFESLGELVASSDLIVFGTVSSVQPGAVLEAEDPEFPTREVNTLLSVDEVLKGAAPAGTVTVATLEAAYASPPNVEWRQPGERVVAFLSRSREGRPLYISASYSQSFYVVQGNALVAAVPETVPPLSGRIAAMSLPQLRRAIEAARGGGG